MKPSDQKTAKRNKKMEKVPIKIVLKNIKIMSKYLRRITICGEDLLHFSNEVLSIARLTAELDIPMRVITNGYHFKMEFLTEMRSLEKDLLISIDTLDKMNKGMKNIEMASKIMASHLGVLSTLKKDREEDICTISNLCSDKGIKHFTCKCKQNKGKYCQDELKCSESLNDLCFAWLNVIILPEGDVIKCPYRKDQEPMGNINKEDLPMILSNRRTNDYIRVMKSCRKRCGME